jgi:hypothetical protein
MQKRAEEVKGNKGEIELPSSGQQDSSQPLDGDIYFNENNIYTYTGWRVTYILMIVIMYR